MKKQKSTIKKQPLKAEKEAKVRDFWQSLWSLLEPSHKRIKILVGFTVVFEAARMVGPFILKLVIDRLADFNPEEIRSVLFLVPLIFLSDQTVALIANFRDKRVLSMIIDVEYYLPVKVHEKLVNLSLSYHVRENTGNKITKIERGINKINDKIQRIKRMALSDKFRFGEEFFH